MTDGSSLQGENNDGANARDSNIAYCLDALRREDRDRYLILLFAPRQDRAVLAALYAFNLECARGVMAGGSCRYWGKCACNGGAMVWKRKAGMAHTRCCPCWLNGGICCRAYWICWRRGSGI